MGMSDSKVQELYQKAARRRFPGMKIEGDVMTVENGAFVQAWVWVPEISFEIEKEREG